MPRRVVIVGGGIVGSALAAELSARDAIDVKVLDRGPPDRLLGSTGHAPGLVSLLSESPVITALAVRSARLYEELESGRAGFVRMGGLELARSERAWQDLQRRARLAAERGLMALVLDTEEAASRAAVFVDRETCRGGVLYPEDGAARADLLTDALRARAAGTGSRFHFGAAVTAIDTRGGRANGVHVSTGERFAADDVVLAAGIWGPHVAKLAGETLPLTAVAHPYVYGPPRPPAPLESFPFVKWREETAYARSHGDRLGIGTHDHEGIAEDVELLTQAERPWPDAIFGPVIQSALRLLPPEHRFTIDRRLNGLFGMTADNLPLLGPSASTAGLWFAESLWVTHAGGAAGVLAAMMTGETPAIEGLATLEPGRFAGQDPATLTARALKKYREIWLPFTSPPATPQRDSEKIGV